MTWGPAETVGMRDANCRSCDLDCRRELSGHPGLRGMICEAEGPGRVDCRPAVIRNISLTALFITLENSAGIAFIVGVFICNRPCVLCPVFFISSYITILHVNGS
jgi:hypothetical protein